MRQNNKIRERHMETTVSNSASCFGSRFPIPTTFRSPLFTFHLFVTRRQDASRRDTRHSHPMPPMFIFKLSKFTVLNDLQISSAA